MSPTRIVELAQIIADGTQTVDEYFTSHNLATPSFDVDGPPAIIIPPETSEVAAAHAAVIDATKELHSLMLGPTALSMNNGLNDVLSLHAIYRYRIASTIPVNEEASFEQISSSCGLNEPDLRRLLRHAMTNHIFHEPREGVVAHSASSRLLSENPLINDFVGILCEERFPAAARTVDALKKYGGPQDPVQTGFSLGHDTNKGLYDELQQHPERSHRFAGAMSAMASKIPLGPLRGGFGWGSLGGATVVDVGGGHGPVSIGLAEAFPDLRFVVQDLPNVLEGAPASLPAVLKERVSFMTYNFLEMQPFKGAEVYFFRAVFHNWPDDYCIKILRNQIPALRHGTHLIINESCLNGIESLPAFMQKRRRSMDLCMLTYFGSRERTVDDWINILHEASPKFNLASATRLTHSTQWLLDVTWIHR